MSEWFGFINIRLQENHKKEIKKLVEKTDEKALFGWFTSVVDDGYKISLSQDRENEAFIVSMTGQERTPNDGWTMTQRHKNPVVAVVACRYAHETLAEREAWENASMPLEYDNW